jgi:hypothetical protein
LSASGLGPQRSRRDNATAARADTLARTDAFLKRHLD